MCRILSDASETRVSISNIFGGLAEKLSTEHGGVSSRGLFVAAAKAATTWNDFVCGKRRKALLRCPDMSRKRDGIVVSALSFLLSPR